jgi:hypothetical protein
MFRGAHRSTSGALTVFAASGLHTYVVTGRSQVRVVNTVHGSMNIKYKIFTRNGIQFQCHRLHFNAPPSNKTPTAKIVSVTNLSRNIFVLIFTKNLRVDACTRDFRTRCVLTYQMWSGHMTELPHSQAIHSVLTYDFCC